MNFSDEYLEHFSRHIRLPELTKAGQEKISQVEVLIVGAGGLGSAAMTYLATLGVKRLGLIDPDNVELSNLPRQIVHKPATVGQSKVASAAERLKELNPDIKLTVMEERFKAANVLKIMPAYDVIIDGTDNFPAKFLLNDAAVMLKKPLVHSGVLRWGGQVMTILPGKSACYRCIFPEPPPPGTIPTCAEAGIFNTVAGVGGLIQATEAAKIITGIGNPLTNRLLVFDLLMMNFRLIDIKRDENCPVCGKSPTIKSLNDLIRCEVKSQRGVCLNDGN